MITLNYEGFNPPFWWEKFNCYVLDSWCDEVGKRHHTCVGENVKDGCTWNNAIIHKEIGDV